MNTAPSRLPSTPLEDHQYRSEYHAMEERIVRQHDALLKLTASSVDDCDRLNQSLERIVEVVATTLDVSRVSVWQYNQARTAITSLALFDADTGSHSAGDVLSARDFPNYFRAMVESELIAVEDAVADPRTAEFSDCYLRPLGIVSMMDAPIHLARAVVGVLCHEHTGERRKWTQDEKAFAIAVSNLVALALERCERVRAEAAARLQVAALNAAADATVISDSSSLIVWVNPAFTVLTGYTAAEAIGRLPSELLKSGRHEAPFYTEMWSTLTQGRVWRGEIFNRRKNGEIYLEDQTITPVTTNGRITHFIAVKRDLTERRKLEGQFLQAQKMEIVGRLAGGIAHDFNNLLTVINGTAELALADLPQDHPLHADFDNIQQCGIRAAGLTRQLLTFSRKQIVQRQPISIADVLTGFRSMLQRLIGEDISLEVSASLSSGKVLADQGQIEQVILNLAVNARDAMPRGGRLSIVASDIELNERNCGTANARPGSYVQLVVSDTGEGMTPEVQAKIFEPFFTTKESGKGTGLGLATVYAIVEQSGGTISVSSAVGEGTSFTICLPRIVAPLGTSAASDSVRAGAGLETVLLVEDDDAVRSLAAAFLSRAGYQVVSACRALDAIQVLAEQTRQVDLIVTDVVLPGMGGRELAVHAVALAPGTPVLFTSGYTDDVMLLHGVRERAVHFLAKPYTAGSLCTMVREILDRKEAGDGDRGRSN